MIGSRIDQHGSGVSCQFALDCCLFRTKACKSDERCRACTSEHKWIIQGGFVSFFISACCTFHLGCFPIVAILVCFFLVLLGSLCCIGIISFGDILIWKTIVVHVNWAHQSSSNRIDLLIQCLNFPFIMTNCIGNVQVAAQPTSSQFERRTRFVRLCHGKGNCPLRCLNRRLTLVDQLLQGFKLEVYRHLLHFAWKQAFKILS
mmetsp:Transcript_23159/g.38293  ORF Transcript_23159/g.38293 Transcript_23159/m.38293 type:complete len:203 (+) Transcript_23159:1051-1659(+)